MSTIYPKERIENEARAAAQRGEELNAACPYPFGSRAGLHFAAVFLVALNAHKPGTTTEPHHA